MNKDLNVQGLKLVVTIVERKKGKKVVKIFEKMGCYYHNTLLGEGTVSKEIFDFLGLGIIEKDVVLSVAPSDLSSALLKALEEQMHFNEPGKGVACTIPISSIDGITSLKKILARED